MPRSYKSQIFSYGNLIFLLNQDPKPTVLETIVLSTKLGLLKNTVNFIPLQDFPFMNSLSAIPPFTMFYEGCQTFNN